ncbi:MAG: glycosyltransferase family 4 protein [Ignavibacteria bacterium]|nr:glycosyltransferase family 4 protein [Ignavibacteria bacterium]
MKKKIAIGFLGNLYFDTRTFNLFHSLKNKGHNVKFYGFDWLTLDFKTINTGEISVKKLNKGRFSVFYYLRFTISLFVSLFKTKADIYFASDFYAMPVCVFIAKLKQKKVFYDSREIYTELPALTGRPALKKTFKIIEGFFINKIDEVFTTGEMDSEYIEKLFGIKKINVLRNLPVYKKNYVPVDFIGKYKLPPDSKIILYQGIIVTGRGIDTYYKALLKDNSFVLVILGGGEHKDYYEKKADELKISERVIFAGKISQNELANYTSGAFAGLSVIDNTSINNYYALPNKLFEYIMAELPVIVSDLPQMKKIVERYKVGAVIKDSNADELIEVLNTWKNEEIYNKLKENCKIASGELNWDAEIEKKYRLFE